ncbi:Hypothetical predicted protein [Xyrichtys novacula]|uniref:Uncharacterized protein n=1 Tax=Xyrichtys novacula TaxID=13765 RepID=A0AAV1GJV5_XYRNO|nr:Hypothetical predicted protein [Xyrichtys novacula]
MGLAERGVLSFYRFTEKDGRACLLMPWDTMFSEKQQEQGLEGGGRGGSRRKKEKEEGGERTLEESGGHMSPLLLCAWVSQALVLNIDAEAGNEHRGWVVDW